MYEVGDKKSAIVLRALVRGWGPLPCSQVYMYDPVGISWRGEIEAGVS